MLDYEERKPQPRWWWRFVWSADAPLWWLLVAIIGAFILLCVGPIQYIWYLSHKY